MRLRVPRGAAAALLVLVLAAPGCRKPGPPAPPDPFAGSPVVARVGDATLTLAELDERWRQLSPAEKSFQGSEARRLGMGSGREHYLEELTEELLLFAEARQRGMDARADVVAAVRGAQRRLATRPLLAEEVRRSAVPESEIEAWYREHSEELGKPGRARVSEIVVTSGVSGPGDETKDAASAREKADRLHARAEAGEDFAALAREGSEAPSAGYGGLLGWVTEGRLSRAWEERAFTLAPGGISEVFEIPEGFAFLRVDEKEPSTVPPLAAAHDEILDRILQDDQDALHRRYVVFVEELKRTATVETHPELVRQPEGSAPAAPGGAP